MQNGLCNFEVAIDELKKACHLVESASGFLQAALRAVMNCTSSRYGEIRLYGRSWAGLRQDLLEYSGRPGQYRHSSTLPLVTQGETVGAICLESDLLVPWLPFWVSGLNDLITDQLARIMTAEHIRHDYGKDVHILGTSKQLSTIDNLIKAACATTLPVVIEGHPGVNAGRLGYLLHYTGMRRPRELVEADCSRVSTDSLRQTIHRVCRCAQENGADFLVHNIHFLPAAMQREIAAVAEYHRQPGPGRLRIIATFDDYTFDHHVQRGSIPHDVARNLDCLRICMPPLCSRPEDIVPLANKFLKKYSVEQKHISADAMVLLQEYAWPQNLHQLEQIMARALNLSRESVISEGDLISVGITKKVSNAGQGMSLKIDPDAFIKSYLRGDREWINSPLHPALKRAVGHIFAHNTNDISVDMLSSAALVSSSHLSLLFRYSFGVSPKQFVTLAKIHSAQKILRLNPDIKIASLATDLGFTETRNFQRSFKQLVGITASEFKHRYSD